METKDQTTDANALVENAYRSLASSYPNSCDELQTAACQVLTDIEAGKIKFDNVQTLRSYLEQRTRSRYVDTNRKKKVFTERVKSLDDLHEDSKELEAEGDSLDRLMQRHELSMLADVGCELTLDQRKVMALDIGSLGKLNAKEIGCQLGMSHAKARQLRSRGKKILGPAHGEAMSGVRCHQIQALIPAFLAKKINRKNKLRLVSHCFRCWSCDQVAMGQGLRLPRVLVPIPVLVGLWQKLRGISLKGGPEAGLSSTVSGSSGAAAGSGGALAWITSGPTASICAKVAASTCAAALGAFGIVGLSTDWTHDERTETRSAEIKLFDPEPMTPIIQAAPPQRTAVAAPTATKVHKTVPKGSSVPKFPQTQQSSQQGAGQNKVSKTSSGEKEKRPKLGDPGREEFTPDV